MRTTKYYSVATTKFPTLAEATWQEFRPYLSRYQWAFDDPKNSCRAAEIASALQNRGRKGSCTFVRDEGYKVILRPLHCWAFTQAVKRRRLYYVSSGPRALLYFDIDLHHAWQTREEGEVATRLLDGLLTRLCGRPALFWADSSRGRNGYLKMHLPGRDYAWANATFARLEHALQRFLAWRGNLADFEVKGRIGFLRGGAYAWQQYGKLPVHQPGWNFPRLEEFRALPHVPLRRLEALCREIEAHIPAGVLERHRAHKRSLGEEPVMEGDRFLVTPAVEQALVDTYGEDWRGLFSLYSEDHEGGVWLGRPYYRAGQAPLTDQELYEGLEQRRPQPDGAPEPDRGTLRPDPLVVPRAAGDPEAVTAGTEQGGCSPRDHGAARTGRKPPLTDLAHEPDSFRRQKEALFRLARSLRRVPTPDEALGLIRAERLFTGPWEQHCGRRQVRVQAILRFIARTFDAGKCAHGSVHVGKYDAWAATRFPRGLTGPRRKDLTPEGEVVERGNVTRVSPRFLATFLAVCEFALVVDHNPDQTLPTRRGKALWEALYAKGLVKERFCGRKWAVCREAMVRHGVIRITDRSYSPGRAMRWAVGPYFPFLGLWKKTSGARLRTGKVGQNRALGQGRYNNPAPSGYRNRTGNRTEGHNTWLRQRHPRVAQLAGSQLPRPPPVAAGLAHG